MPSLIFTVIVLGTQVIALILSVYGAFGDNANISGIGWGRGMIIIAISLGIFLVIDMVKVITISIWERFNTSPSLASPSSPSKAAAFIKNRSRSGYDRAMRHESEDSIKSY